MSRRYFGQLIAAGNKVSLDTAIRVPNSLRWIAGPRLQDSNGANGWRIDDGIAVSEWNLTLDTRERERDEMVVEARDAFNGTLLWQRVEWIRRGGTASIKTKPLIMDDGRLLRMVDDLRPRPRWDKGEAIPGVIQAFRLDDGAELDAFELDAAVINNGLAVAGGRLHAVCEDGTVRCYGE